jgi:predicted O-methyltransferase YrrM
MSTKKKELISDICKQVLGPISEKEVLFLYDSAKSIKNGVIVELGAANGRSTVCLAKGSQAGYGVKIYSIDPHIPDLYTSDPEWLASCNTGADGTPDERYYVKQGTGHLEFYDNIKKFGVDNIVIPIQDYSEMAYKKGLGKEWDIPIGLLFIDADHRFNYVKKDFELWAKWVVRKGKVLMHDRQFPGVTRVINEMILNNSRYRKIKDIHDDPIFNCTVR